MQRRKVIDTKIVEYETMTVKRVMYDDGWQDEFILRVKTFNMVP